MAKIFFPEQKEYNGRIFKKNETYDIQDEIPGFIDRWLKRGCIIVEDKKEDIKEFLEKEVVFSEITEIEDKKTKRTRVKK